MHHVDKGLSGQCSGPAHLKCPIQFRRHVFPAVTDLIGPKGVLATQDATAVPSSIILLIVSGSTPSSARTDVVC